MESDESLKSKPTLITNQLLDSLSQKASSSDRLRWNYNLHRSFADKSQRFLNAIEPGSYIRPHRHRTPPKEELVFLIRGKGALVSFDDSGHLSAVYPLESSLGTWGVEAPASVYHTIVSFAKGTVFLEVKQGPFIPDVDKSFAYWAPDENTPEAHRYLHQVEKQVSEVFNSANDKAYGATTDIVDELSLFWV